MADDVLTALGKAATDLCAPKLREKYGDVYVRDAEIMGLAIAATLATVIADPERLLLALGGVMQVDGAWERSTTETAGGVFDGWWLPRKAKS